MCIRSEGMCAHPCTFFVFFFFSPFFFFGVVCEFNISLRALCLCIFCAKLYTVTLCRYVELNHDSENKQNWNWKENKLNLSTYSLRSSLAWTSFDSRLRYTSRSRSTLLLSMFNAAQSWYIKMKHSSISGRNEIWNLARFIYETHKHVEQLWSPLWFRHVVVVRDP